jgi:microtubule-associated protein, RP/EB family
MTDSIGIMEGAFFVGKNEILNWINQTYKLNMAKIEQACTGAVYCQIIDSLHPKKVKMHKVNWRAKLEHEFIANFKILQQAFTDCKINKNIEVEKLVKGKYQDNLEFMQWMKRYFDNKQISVDYDPLERRNNAELEICNEGNGMKSRNNSKPHTLPQSSNPFLSNKNSKAGIKSVEKSVNIGKKIL